MAISTSMLTKMQPQIAKFRLRLLDIIQGARTRGYVKEEIERFAPQKGLHWVKITHY